LASSLTDIDAKFSVFVAALPAVYNLPFGFRSNGWSLTYIRLQVRLNFAALSPDEPQGDATTFTLI